MISSVLVIGANGKSGRRLIPKLAEKGIDARQASRKPRAGQVTFDWHRPETYDAVLAGIDAIYLVTPDFVVDSTGITGPFLERARTAGVSRVVAITSLGVEFPTDGLQSGRKKLEAQVETSGLEWTILRPSGFNQNFSEDFLLPGILQSDTIATATGDGAAAFVDADDIAAVAAEALVGQGHAGERYVVTGPQALTFTEMAAIIGEVAGRAIVHRRIEAEDFRGILLGAGMPADYAAMVVGDQEAIRDGHGARVTDAVERVAGRQPKAFADYARDAAGAWARR